MAPSIFANSRKRVAENGTSMGKPPESIESVVRSVPRITNAPVLPRKMRSRPSRRAVPGASRRKVSRRTASIVVTESGTSILLAGGRALGTCEV